MLYSISCGNIGIGGDLSPKSILEAIKFVLISLPNQEKIKVRVYKRRTK